MTAPDDRRRPRSSAVRTLARQSALRRRGPIRRRPRRPQRGDPGPAAQRLGVLLQRPGDCALRRSAARRARFLLHGAGSGGPRCVAGRRPLGRALDPRSLRLAAARAPRLGADRRGPCRRAPGCSSTTWRHRRGRPRRRSSRWPAAVRGRGPASATGLRSKIAPWPATRAQPRRSWSPAPASCSARRPGRRGRCSTRSWPTAFVTGWRWCRPGTPRWPSRCSG